MNKEAGPMISMMTLKGKIYIEVNSLDALYNYLIKRHLEMPEDERMDNQISEQFIEGHIGAYDFLKRQLKDTIQNFAVETELDAIGLGDGATTIFKVDDKKP